MTSPAAVLALRFGGDLTAWRSRRFIRDRESDAAIGTRFGARPAPARYGAGF